MKPSINYKRLLQREIEDMDLFIWARTKEDRPLINPELPKILNKSLIKRLPSILLP